VPSLLVGEAVIEGIGASLMMPSTLAILSNTFQGPERATAFSAWGATAGSAVAFGPVIGGVLTTNYTWRWAFGINVIVAPLAVAGALLFMQARRPESKPLRIDVAGAALIAAGMFLVVFALSEGGTYGWWHPILLFSVGGSVIWTTSTGSR
jgi:predicted MFS family arabinose efflux permease